MAPSPVVTAFHEALVAEIPADLATALRGPVGGAVEKREMSRALLIAHRAGAAWAGETLASFRPNLPSNLRQLAPFAHPEAGTDTLGPAARAVLRPALDNVDLLAMELLDKVIDLGDALARLYEDAPLQTNDPEFRDVGRLSAKVLLSTRSLREDNNNWVFDQAEQILIDLIDPGRDWPNRS